MLHPVASLVFVKRLTVELIQSVRVLREMRRHPVEYHADSQRVELVHEILEIVWRAVARGRRIIAADLIAPRAVERVLHYWQQLDVCISHLLRVWSELISDFAIIQVVLAVLCSFVVTCFPRAEVNLVYVERRAEKLARCTTAISDCFHAPRAPERVGPFEHSRLIYLRRGAAQGLGAKRVGVGFEEGAPLIGDAIFIILAVKRFLARQLVFPHAHVGDAGEGISRLPVVEVADQLDALGVRSPDAEGIFVRVVLFFYVTAEVVVGVCVCTLMEIVRRHVVLFCVTCFCQRGSLLIFFCHLYDQSYLSSLSPFWGRFRKR